MSVAYIGYIPKKRVNFSLANIKSSVDRAKFPFFGLPMYYKLGS